jgi:hypothetical protein
VAEAVWVADAVRDDLRARVPTSWVSQLGEHFCVSSNVRVVQKKRHDAMNARVAPLPIRIWCP